MSYIKNNEVDLSAYVSDSFETVSRNIGSYPYAVAYDGAVVTSVTYDLGAGFSIVKTFNYAGNQLIRVTLSGLVPSSVNDKIKTLAYSGTKLTSVIYS